MFEQIVTGRLFRARRALREFLDLSACRVFTVRQQILWALAIGALGAAAAALAAAQIQAHSLTPVVILDPVVERLAPDYSVYRIRFAWRGIETPPCHIVIYGEAGKWTVRC